MSYKKYDDYWKEEGNAVYTAKGVELQGVVDHIANLYPIYGGHQQREKTIKAFVMELEPLKPDAKTIGEALRACARHTGKFPSVDDVIKRLNGGEKYKGQVDDFDRVAYKLEMDEHDLRVKAIIKSKGEEFLNEVYKRFAAANDHLKIDSGVEKVLGVHWKRLALLEFFKHKSEGRN